MASGDMYDYVGEKVKIEAAKEKFLEENGSMEQYQFTSLIAVILDEYFIQKKINVKDGWKILVEVADAVHNEYDFLYPDTDSIK